MCCGNDGPALEEIVMAEERDHAVYTTVPGAEITVGNYGAASNESPAMVPASVAEELAGRADLRIEAPAAEPKKKARKGQEE